MSVRDSKGWQRIRALIGTFFASQSIISVVRGASYLLAGNSLVFIFGLLQTGILAHYLGDSGYGRLGLILSAVGFVNLLLSLRIWEFTTRYLTESLAVSDFGKAWSTVGFSMFLSLTLGILAFFLVVFLAPSIATSLLEDRAYSELVVMYSVSLVAMSLAGPSNATLRVFAEFKTLATLDVIGAAVRLALITFVARWDSGLQGVIIAYTAGNLFGGSLRLIFMVRTVRSRLGRDLVKAFDISPLRSDKKDISRLLLHTSLLNWLKGMQSKLDDLVLGVLGNPALVGQYRLAKVLVRLLLKLSNPLYQALYPELVRLWSRALTLIEYRRSIREITILCALCFFPAAVLIFMVAPVGIAVIGGSEFVDSAPLSRIMVWGLAFNLSQLWLHPTAIAMDKPIYSNYVNLFSVILWGGLAFTLIPSMGVLGAAWAYTISIVARTLLMYQLVNRHMVSRWVTGALEKAR